MICISNKIHEFVETHGHASKNKLQIFNVETHGRASKNRIIHNIEKNHKNTKTHDIKKTHIRASLRNI